MKSLVPAIKWIMAFNALCVIYFVVLYFQGLCELPTVGWCLAAFLWSVTSLVNARMFESNRQANDKVLVGSYKFDPPLLLKPGEPQRINIKIPVNQELLDKIEESEKNSLD